MGAPKGSKNALGNKGGGRPSAKDEISREKMVLKAIGKWQKAVRDLDNVSGKEMDKLKALIMPIVSKAVPREMNLESNVTLKEEEQTLRRLNEIQKDESSSD